MATNPLLEGVRPIRSDRAQLPVGDVALEVLIVEPEEGGPWPTILLIHENRGLVPYMIDVAEALAQTGYRVVAPDLLSRIGGTDRYADDPASVSARQIATDIHVADLAAVYDWLVAQSPSVTVVGFCFGGEMGWQLITKRSPRGAVLYYGIGPDAEGTALIRTAVYAVYAQDDPRVNDTLPELADPLAGAGIDYILESYPGTKHAFHDHSRQDRYHEEAASVVWHQTLAFLEDAAREP